MLVLLVLLAPLVGALRAPATPNRRNVVLGSACVLCMPLSKAAASDKGAAKYASGYEPPKSPQELRGEALAQVYEPFSNAFNANDATRIGALYTSDATLIDATSKPQMTIKGSEIGDYLSTFRLGEATFKLTRLNAELQYDGSSTRTLHTQYTCDYSGGRFTGYCRLVAEQGKWKVRTPYSAYTNA